MVLVANSPSDICVLSYYQIIWVYYFLSFKQNRNYASLNGTVMPQDFPDDEWRHDTWAENALSALKWAWGLLEWPGTINTEALYGLLPKTDGVMRSFSYLSALN